MAAPRVKRDDSLRINMSTETKERLQRVADAFGMPPATIAALAIGQYIAQQERTLVAVESMTDKMAQAVGGELGEQLKLFIKEGRNSRKAKAPLRETVGAFKTSGRSAGNSSTSRICNQRAYQGQTKGALAL